MNYQHICLFSYDDRTVCRAYRDQVIGELVVGGKVQLKWPTSGDSYEIYNARILGMCGKLFILSDRSESESDCG